MNRTRSLVLLLVLCLILLLCPVIVLAEEGHSIQESCVVKNGSQGRSMIGSTDDHYLNHSSEALTPTEPSTDQRYIVDIIWDESNSYMLLEDFYTLDQIQSYLPPTLTVFLEGDSEPIDVIAEWEMISQYEFTGIKEYIFEANCQAYSSNCPFPHICVTTHTQLPDAQLFGESSGYLIPKTNDNQIASRIDELYSLLGNKYFNTKLNSGCYSSWYRSHSCDQCLNSNIVKSNWFISIFGNVSVSLFPHQEGYSDGWSCYGFANFAEWFIFRESNNSNIHIDPVGGQINFNQANMTQYARIGDVLRLDGSHSAIFISCDNNHQFTVFSQYQDGPKPIVSQHL